MRSYAFSAPSLFLLLLGLLSGAPAGATISGVCPDGSIFIVQQIEAIPCRAAKLVEPDEVPPIRPEYLPKPYGWQVFHEQQDPNNPYNLVDKARAVRGSGPAERVGESVEAEAEAPREVAVATPPVSARGPATHEPVVDLSFSSQELRDLALIVELSQQRAPASFPRDPDVAAPLVVRLAHSESFESRVRDSRRGARDLPDGPVVLFAAEASAPSAFYGNLTFSQGHNAFHPDPDDPRHFGLLEGSLGRLDAGEAVLGYAVLPESVDVSQPVDVYWNDQRLTATLRP